MMLFIVNCWSNQHQREEREANREKERESDKERKEVNPLKFLANNNTMLRQMFHVTNCFFFTTENNKEKLSKIRKSMLAI